MDTPPVAIVIDDNFDIRTIFSDVLTGIGLVVMKYGSPVEALNVLQTQTFDIMILDLQMPEISGNDILKQIRLNPIHASMKIVVVTAFPHMAIGREIDSAADYVMNKPVSPIAFGAFIKRVIPSRRN